MLYFSLRRAFKINGKVYSPCICYSLPDNLLPTIQKLEKEGQAVIYATKVAFQNGAIITARSSDVTEAPAKEKKTKKKVEKKTETLAETMLEEKEEDIPEAEEVSEENIEDSF